MTPAAATQRVEGPGWNKPRWWMPKIWLGCGVTAWARMLLHNRFSVKRSSWLEAALYSFSSLANSTLGLLQRVIYVRRISKTHIAQPPLFILGHWRTGTTFLHELLVQDPRHTFPSSYDCFAPHHFLLTGRIAQRWLGFVVPAERTMDNMPLGLERPQEDEFALCNLGIPSPYATIAFPGRPDQCREYFNLNEISRRDRELWKETFLRFIKQLTFRDPRRLVLKSPAHTCRLDTLLELFPDARFLHIVRDPYAIFPSTVHLWRSLYTIQGLQTPDLSHLEESVFERFLMMYERLDETRHLVRPGRFHEVRYEDLVANPLGELAQIYERLELGDFELARANVESYLSGVKGYQTNRYRLATGLRDEITERWGEQIRRLGYRLQPGGAV